MGISCAAKPVGWAIQYAVLDSVLTLQYHTAHDKLWPRQCIGYFCIFDRFGMNKYLDISEGGVLRWCSPNSE